MTTNPSPQDSLPHGTLRSYVLGFALSLVLTLGAFLLAPHLGNYALPVIVIAALAQLFVQLVFFLHMGQKRSPLWNLLVFVFTAVIIGILVVGTLWIMSNLAHLHLESPTTTDLYKDGMVMPQNELR